jgi:hypothetical protein
MLNSAAALLCFAATLLIAVMPFAGFCREKTLREKPNQVS